MTKPTVLVTGGAGYIGSHAVLALADAGWPVVVLDDLSTGFRWAVPDGVAFVEGEVGDRAVLDAVLAEHAVGAAMHFAGSIIVPESVADPLKYYGNNTAASRTLIDACVGAGVRHMVFSSTAATYGTPPRSPVAEGDPTVPINPYGRSKLMTEWMLADTAAAHPFNYCALRYFNVAGADPAGRSGQSTAGATHLIKVAVEAALGRARRGGRVRHGLRHGRRHRGARLHPCQRPGRRARAGAGRADRRPGGEPCAQLRLWARRVGAAGAGRGGPGGGRDPRTGAWSRAGPAIRRSWWRTPPPSGSGSDGGRSTTTSTASWRTRWRGSGRWPSGRGQASSAASFG